MDYRELLKKYVYAVAEAEGDDFASQVGNFDEDERREVVGLLSEANKENKTGQG